MRIAIAAMACLCAMPALAANAVLIRDATVHTMTARGVLAHTDVLVENGKLTAIGPALAVPPGARIVEASGRPVTPGLFGGLTQLGLHEIDFEPTVQDEALSLGPMRPEFDVSLAFNPESAAIAVNSIEGVTFVALAPTTAGSIVAGQGAIASLDGRAASTARALFVNLGGDANALSGGSRAAQSMLLRQALLEVQKPASLLTGDPRLLTPSGRVALAGYLAGQRPVIFDVDRAADIRQALALIRETGIRGVIAGASEAWRVAEELKAADVPVVLDPFTAVPLSFDKVGATLENAARLHRAGVKVAFSFRDEASAFNNSRRLRQAAANAVAHGLPHDVALAGLTRIPAEIFGVADRVGTLEVGKPADLVIWSGDPLEVTTVADQVFVAGTAHSMRSRQTELREKYRPNGAN